MEFYWLLLGGAAAFLVAWINGANNAANAIGTAVGSRALNVKQALWLAAAFDFMGAMLFGRFVSKTLLKGIVDTSQIGSAYIIVVGMISALFATGIWVIIATLFKIPMSISQAIVGGVTGFGIAVLGINGVNWAKITEIVVSWLVLPFMSALIALLLYYLLLRLTREITRRNLIILALTLYFIMIFTTALLLGIKTLKISDLAYAIGSSLAYTIILTIPFLAYIVKKTPREPRQAKKFIFRLLLIASAAAMAFSHGANDVANSAGPLSGIIYAVYENAVPETVTIPLSALALSAFGIASGILIWGFSVIETIGEKITPLSIETAFIAQFSGSIAVLIVTRLGLPVSTTVSIVGAVAGVGLARGVKNVNLRLLGKIVAAWFLGFPFVAGLTMLILYFIV